MKKTSKLLFVICVITVFLAFSNFADAMNAIANMPGDMGLEDYLRSQAIVGLLLWLGVGITEATVAYLLNEKT